MNQLIAVNQRQDNHCGKVNAGYILYDKTCLKDAAYGGSCPPSHQQQQQQQHTPQQQQQAAKK